MPATVVQQLPGNTRRPRGFPVLTTIGLAHFCFHLYIKYLHLASFLLLIIIYVRSCTVFHICQHSLCKINESKNSTLYIHIGELFHLHVCLIKYLLSSRIEFLKSVVLSSTITKVNLLEYWFMARIQIINYNIQYSFGRHQMIKDKLSQSINRQVTSLHHAVKYISSVKKVSN